MNRFNWVKGVVYGILIWGIAVAALAMFVNWSPMSAGWTHGLTAVVFGIAAYLFGINVRSADEGYALGYGALWAAIGIGLDALITRFFDAHIFTTWQYYIGYALVLLAPLLHVEYRRTTHQLTT